MSEASNKRSEEFLKISGQFKLGALVTESSHPVTANLSEVAKQDIAQALDLLFQVDNDVIAKYREFAESGRAEQIKETVLRALKNGGKIFFTGCGSTGRLSILLDSVWRDYWQQTRRGGDESPNFEKSETPHVVSCGKEGEDYENRTFSVMAGGDFALIKSVEGFEDFAAFGKKQIGDLGVSSKDVVFAITEGGETSFVIGTAWKGVEVGAKVYFVYNNPDDILCRHVERSREVIEDARIEKINLTTGPMAITGSTRMQATTIQLCVLLTVLEMVVRELAPENGDELPAKKISSDIYQKLVRQMLELRAPKFLQQLASLISLEESVYRSGHKNNYYSNAFGIDVLTDTTERSPTYCTPPFRKFDDTRATESWSFLFLPYETPQAWNWILKREPQCVEWSEAEVRDLVGEEKFAKTFETIQKISETELMRFKIGTDGVDFRKLSSGDSAIVISNTGTNPSSAKSEFFRTELKRAHSAGARTGWIQFGTGSTQKIEEFVSALPEGCVCVFVPRPADTTRLGIVRRVTAKILLNTLSTCTMVRLGRVMGNYMIWVVASNLKLIDRATRYIQKLTGLAYEDANRLLFEVVEYVEPRMKADQAYPPVVGMAVLRARHKLTNEQAEERLKKENG
jgi:N-acetylmuramic acid 6-phosphate etherase